jgi:hypothetical protein
VRNANFAGISGIAGMFGAALWLVALFIEYAYNLFPPGEGPLFAANQAMFFVAQLCFLAVIAGLVRSGAAGDGWFGKISLGLFFFGWAALASALGLSLVSDAPVADAIVPIGGVTSTLGGLLAGVAAAAAGRLRDPWRFAPLVQGSYYALVLFLPLFFGREPTQVTESLWTGTWFLIGLALFASARNEKPASDREARGGRGMNPRPGRENTRGAV